MKPIRVLHVLGEYFPDHTTGTAHRVRGLVLPMVREGKCEVDIIRPHTQGNHGKSFCVQEIDGVTIHCGNGTRLSPKRLRNLLSNTRFDLIHCHGVWDTFVSHLAGQGIRTITEIHTVWPTGPIKKSLYSLAYRLSHKVIVLTPKMKSISESLYGLPRHKIVMIPNGVDTNLFRPSQEQRVKSRTELGINESSVVGFTGSFQPWQGLELLIRSFKMLVDKNPDVRLLLVGDGPLRPETEGMISGLGLNDNVTITGLVSQNKVAEYLNCIDIFVAARPSMLETETATPLKLLEAMASGRAVIASKVDGMSSIIEDGRTGILIDPGNIRELTTALNRLLSREWERIKIGERSRLEMTKGFGWEQSSKLLFDTYQNAL